MKRDSLQELADKLGVSHKAVDEVYVNPLRLLINDEFGRNVAGDYRDRVIKRALKSGVSFSSEANTIWDLGKLVLCVVNPKTGNEMEYHGGSGSGDVYTFRFIDKKTKDEISISLPSEGIFFRSGEERD